MIKMLVAVSDKMLVAVNDKMAVAEMRQKFRIDFLSVASVRLYAAPTDKRRRSNENFAHSPQAGCAEAGFSKLRTNCFAAS